MFIKVHLVDDHTIMREGLISLLRDAPDIEVLAESATGRMAVEQALTQAPDVVIMDLTLPEMSGIEATRQIMANNPLIRVLILSMVLDKHCLMESLDAGAKGYLVKDCAAEELVTAIRSVAAGKLYFCSEATELLIGDVTRQAVDSNVVPITKREREVLKMTAEGLNTKEIAFTLGVSVKTVEVNRMNLKKKLNLRSIAELTKYAVREGMSSIN
jgi:DNA-binding NarL/FixJ family response regulator